MTSRAREFRMWLNWSRRKMRFAKNGYTIHVTCYSHSVTTSYIVYTSIDQAVVIGDQDSPFAVDTHIVRVAQPNAVVHIVAHTCNELAVGFKYLQSAVYLVDHIQVVVAVSSHSARTRVSPCGHQTSAHIPFRSCSCSAHHHDAHDSR